MFFFRSHPAKGVIGRGRPVAYTGVPPIHTCGVCCNPTFVFQVPQHMCAMQEWVPAVVCAPAYHDGEISQWSFAYVYDAAAWLTMNSGALSAGPLNEWAAFLSMRRRGQQDRNGLKPFFNGQTQGIFAYPAADYIRVEVHGQLLTHNINSNALMRPQLL